jgi:hypothetical protein
MHPPVTNGQSVDRVAQLATSTKFGESRSGSMSPRTTPARDETAPPGRGPRTVCGHSAREKVRTFPPLLGGNRNVLKILQ